MRHLDTNSLKCMYRLELVSQQYFTSMLNQICKIKAITSTITSTEHRPKTHCVKQNSTSFIDNIVSNTNNQLFSLRGLKWVLFNALQRQIILKCMDSTSINKKIFFLLIPGTSSYCESLQLNVI